ncbi:uncharacterized protein LOC108892174 [Lates calcarifer]|uniref:Uncharacterized protein LOC108892174 n=1 Tax=Lates calcarifer TaxID=8187 RepID=A0AAJ7Q2P1_LATCA|nr:uncharacterized protein LOC108892174 [Lates calcarifer]XP_018545117.1 uncharacterized protein LOC108892174 [Lates calcarifer]
MKMSNRWWITVTLVFSLPALRSAAPDQNRLPGLIQEIRRMKNGFNINTMYSVALSLPVNHWYDLSGVTKPTAQEGQGIKNGEVFRNSRLSMATVLTTTRPPTHAEWRVLNNLHLQSNDGDLFVIFAHASPCDANCANPGSPRNIIDLINNVINRGAWRDKAFVFENIFTPRGQQIADKNKLKQALRDLGTSSIGLANIFRCFQSKRTRRFRCTSCATGGDVTDDCVNYNA